MAYLNNGEQQPARYTPELNGKYELIVIVANEGRTDQVMNAARAAGATGGTVLHGKGTGALKEEIRKYLRTVDLVASAKDEHEESGGAGITVVRLEL